MSDPNRNESSYSEKPNSSDTISRQAAIDVANKLIDRFEQILRDIRETNEDESVCGMCEYDGAFIGQSGDWCNECPGFDRADCFKLSEERRKKWLKELDLPSAQPKIVRCKDCKWKQGSECVRFAEVRPFPDDFCSRAERRKQ